MKLGKGFALVRRIGYVFRRLIRYFVDILGLIGIKQKWTLISLMCDKVPETVEHYIFDCDIYTEERKESVEAILSREGLNCSVIGFKCFIKQHSRYQ